MKRLDSTLLKVFGYGLPGVIVFAVFSYFYRSGFFEAASGRLGLLNALSGLVLALWMTLSLYLSVKLIVSGTFRDQVIARLTFIRERDEREAILTGKAARTTFLTSLALLIFLFCLSCFHVSIYQVPPEMAVDGKTGTVSLGLAFDILGNHRKEAMAGARDIFSYSGLPVSSTVVILFLIVWQIISYNYSMWRLTRS